MPRGVWLAALLCAALGARAQQGKVLREPVRDAVVARGAVPGVVRVGVAAGGPFGHSGASAGLELERAREAGLDALFVGPSDALEGGAPAAVCFALDGPLEPLGGDADGHKRVEVHEPRLSRPRAREAEEAGRTLEHVFDSGATRDGSPSLKLATSGGNAEAYEPFWAELAADGGLHQQALPLGVRARLWVLPLEQSADSRAFVEFELSLQPHSAGGGRGGLHYFLSNAAEPPEVRGSTVFLPVPYEPGAWNELVLELSADARAHARGGIDNAVCAIRLGVESRFQSPAVARFDQLVLERELSGPAARECEQALFGELARGAGLELHDGLACGVPRAAGLVPCGADLVLLAGEPGALAAGLAAWDDLARAGLAPIAIGAGGELGRQRAALAHGARGLASFVLADSADEEALLGAIARGRVCFGDPGVFSGALDLESERGFRMGQVVLTDRDSASVSIARLGPAPAGEDYAWTSAGQTSYDQGAGRIDLGELPGWVRAKALGKGARPVAFSNALHFVRACPAGGLAPERAAFDVAGARSTRLERLRLLDVRGAEDRGGLTIEGRVEGAGGLLVIGLERESEVAVAWDGLRGTSEQRGSELCLLDLAGEGRVTLRWGR